MSACCGDLQTMTAQSISTTIRRVTVRQVAAGRTHPTGASVPDALALHRCSVVARRTTAPIPSRQAPASLGVGNRQTTHGTEDAPQPAFRRGTSGNRGRCRRLQCQQSACRCCFWRRTKSKQVNKQMQPPQRRPARFCRRFSLAVDPCVRACHRPRSLAQRGLPAQRVRSASRGQTTARSAWPSAFDPQAA